MKNNRFFGKNIKLYLLMGIIILLGTIGVTAAITISNFRSIAINTTSSIIDANITYDEGTNTAEVINNGNMLPISDDLVSIDTTDTRVLKVKFNVSGVESNPDNTIYDVAMHFDDLDCELRTNDLKWRLYKNNSLLNEGSLSPTFDTINNNRLVLTNTQENLTNNTDKYTFLLWISESCTGDITQCDSSMDQSKYLNKVLNGSIKIELSTGSKKEINRITGEEGSCNYEETIIPLCNDLTYNGSSQMLVNNSDNYKIINNTGVNAGSYSVTLDLEDGYKWNDGSTDNKVISCDIDKYDVEISTLNQSIKYGEEISNSSAYINNSNLIEGHSLSSYKLVSDIYDVGVGKISVNNPIITDSVGNNVTSNYNIKYKEGEVTINCLNISVLPGVSDKIYSGEEQMGITGGEYITISGDKSGTEIGTYNVIVTPQKNYCWSDNTTEEKNLSWKITPVINTILLDNQDAETIGTASIYSVDNNLCLDSECNSTMSTTSNNITVPKKTGYTFNGYYTNSDGTGTMMINSEGYATEVLLNTSYKDDITLYANWSVNSYTYSIVYKSNSGLELGTDTVTHDFGTTNTISPKSFIGYTSPSSQEILWDSVNDKSITFVYVPNVYTIIYDLDGGSVSSNPTSYTIESSDIILNAPTKSGYTFAGWRDDQNLMSTYNVNEGVIFDGNTITITNSTSGNQFSCFKFQLWDDSVTNFIEQIAVQANSGRTSVKYTHSYDTGNYILRGGANGSTADYNFYENVYLVNGVTYIVEWNIVSASSDKYVIQNLKFYKENAASVGIPVDVIPTGSCGDRSLTALWTDSTPPSINLYSGNILYDDPEFASGINGVTIYNNAANGAVTITRKAISGIPNSSGYGLEIVTNGTSRPGLGGFYFANMAAANKQFVTRIVAKIPVGYTINFATNGIGDNYEYGWKTDTAGTGDWEEYIFVVKCGSTGTFSSTNFFYLDGGSAPVTWQVAYATVIDTTHEVKNYIISNVYDLFGVAGYQYTTSNSQPTSWVNYSDLNQYRSPSMSAPSSGTYYLWAVDPAGNVASSSVGISDVVYTITYDANGGSGAPSAQSYAYASSGTTNLSSVQPSRTGYTFLGWSIDKNATSASYSAGQAWKLSNASNYTLYAVWKLNTYTVSFDANGGTGAPSSQTKTYGVTLKLSSTLPTRTGYTFKGWSLNKSATSATWSAGGDYTVNASNTLYAVWQLVPTVPTISVVNRVGSTSGSVYDGSWTNQNVYTTISYSSNGPALDLSTLQYGYNYADWKNLNTTNCTDTTCYDEWTAALDRHIDATYRICDVEGNCATTSFELKHDITPPSCELEFSGSFDNPELMIHASDSLSGLASVPYLWSDFTSNYSTNAIRAIDDYNGYYTVKVKDAAGNVNSCSYGGG